MVRGRGSGAGEGGEGAEGEGGWCALHHACYMACCTLHTTCFHGSESITEIRLMSASRPPTDPTSPPPTPPHPRQPQRTRDSGNPGPAHEALAPTRSSRPPPYASRRDAASAATALSASGRLRPNPKREQLQSERNAQIELENYLLLTKLSRILERPMEMGPAGRAAERGGRGARGAPAEPSSLNIIARQRLQHKIVQENMQLVRRLQACRPTYDIAKLEADADERQRWMQRRAASKHATAAAATRGAKPYGVTTAGCLAGGSATGRRPRPQSAPVTSAAGALTGSGGAGARPGSARPGVGRPGSARPDAARPPTSHGRRPPSDAAAGARAGDARRVLQFISKRMAGAATLDEMREARSNLMLSEHPIGPDVRIETISTADVDIEVVSAPATTERAHSEPVLVLLVHGGMFMSGTPRSVRHLAARLSAELGVPVATPALRLAPEHQHPAPLHDLAAALDYLSVHGVQRRDGVATAPRIALVAESSGCAIALAELQRRAAAGAAMPVAVVYASPWLDLTCAGFSYTANEAHDPVLKRDRLLSVARSYTGDDHELADPAVSPLMAPMDAFANLPPTLIHVGDTEVVLDDAHSLETAMAAAGGIVRLREFTDVIHAWHLFFPIMPQAEAAVLEVLSFLRPYMGQLPAVQEEAEPTLPPPVAAADEVEAAPADRLAQLVATPDVEDGERNSGES